MLYDGKGNKIEPRIATYDSHAMKDINISDETYLTMRLNDTNDADIDQGATSETVFNSTFTAIENLIQTKIQRIIDKKGCGNKGDIIAYINSRGVSQNGRLSVKGTDLVNEKGEVFQLTGMSTFTQALGTTAYMYEGILTTKIYGANAVRACNYTVSSPWGTEKPGYTDGGDKEWHKKIIKRIIRDAIALDMYVIVDWHCIRATEYDLAGYQDQAIEFFEDIANTFPDCPNIIYEICNEPRVEWEEIKAYANVMIPVIRAISPNAVVLIGTPINSYDLSYPANNPVTFDNIMYVWHNYPGTFDHTTQLAPYVGKIPVFVTEWGVTNNTGDGDLFLEESLEFIQYMKEKKISWTYWALYFKNNACYILPTSQHGVSYGGWTQEQLTPAGQFIVEHFDDVGMFEIE